MPSLVYRPSPSPNAHRDVILQDCVERLRERLRQIEFNLARASLRLRECTPDKIIVSNGEIFLIEDDTPTHATL